MSSGESSQITGETIKNICKLYAAYLCGRIYHEPEGKGSALARFPDEKNKTEALWARQEFFDDQKQTGMVGAFYRPVGSTNGDGGEACWPMLVYRGTDFDDFRGIGFSFVLTSPRLEKEYKYEDFVDASGEIKSDIGLLTEELYKSAADWGKKTYVDPAISDGQKKLDKFANTTSEKREDPPSQRVAGEPYLSIGWVQNHPEVRTAAQAEALSGYKVIELINKTGKAGLGPLSDKFHIRACLVYKEKEHGDWVTNLLQGMGKETPAYEQALAFAADCYEKQILANNDKRVITTGHSMGGGLASAANIWLRKKYLLKGHDFYGLTFNTAGVHSNTVAPASLSDGKIENIAVRDEILTTLAWYSNRIPFLGGILKMSNYQAGLPKPSGSRSVIPGVSPGPLSEGEGWNVPPKNSLLARLFPLSQQNALWRARATHNFRSVNAISDILLNAGSINDFGIRLLRHIGSAYTSFSDKDREELMKLPDRAGADVMFADSIQSGKKFFANIGTELSDLCTILEMSAGYHGMDFCIASLEAKLKGTATSVHHPYSVADSTKEKLDDLLNQDNQRRAKEEEAINKAQKAYQDETKASSDFLRNQFSSNGGLAGVKF